MVEKLTPAELGRRGGNATFKKHGVEHMRKMAEKSKAVILNKYGPDFYKNISKKGVEARRRKKLEREGKL